MPILWLPRRCIFDGFLQDFEAFKGYVRPPVGPSVFGWLGLNPAGVSLFRMHRPLHVLGALKFKAEAATEAAIPSPSTTWFCMFLERFPEGAFSIQDFEALKGYVRPSVGPSAMGALMSCKLVSMRVLSPLSYVGFLCVFCVQCGLFKDLCRTMWAEILRVWLAGES